MSDERPIPVQFSPNLQDALYGALTAGQRLALAVSDVLGESAAGELAAALQDGGCVRVSVELPIGRLAVVAQRAGDARTLLDVTLDHRSIEPLPHATH